MLSLEEYLRIHRKNVLLDIKDVPMELYRNTRALYYDVPASDTVYRVFAYISMPKKVPPKGGFPAVILLHGGRGMAYYEVTNLWAERGFVAIMPDLNGKCAESAAVRNKVNPLGGPSGYGTNIRGEHPWAFFSVLSAMRAVDVLTSFPNVNPEKICSCGLSWGGFLNLLFASQEKRLKAVSIIYSSAYTDESIWGRWQLSTLSQQEYLFYVNKIEPKNYLSQITVPVFLTAGTDDYAFSMGNRYRTAEALNVPVIYSLRRHFLHANIYGFEEPESTYFCSEVLKGHTLAPIIAERNGLAVYVYETNKNSVLSLVYTCRDIFALPPYSSYDNPEVQAWKEIPMKSGTAILPENCTAYFVCERQKNGLSWSSKIYLM